MNLPSNTQELIWVLSDEVVEGDRIVLADDTLACVTGVEYHFDGSAAGYTHFHFDGGTHVVTFDADVQVAPNPAIEGSGWL